MFNINLGPKYYQYQAQQSIINARQAAEQAAKAAAAAIAAQKAAQAAAKAKLEAAARAAEEARKNAQRLAALQKANINLDLRSGIQGQTAIPPQLRLVTGTIIKLPTIRSFF